MYKKLITIAITATICALFTIPSNAQIPYATYELYTNIQGTTSATSTGWAVETVNNVIGTKIKLYKFQLLNCNTTANTITLYDAATYSYATLNNTVIGKITFDGTTTWKMGSGAAPVIGDVGATLDFTAGPDGRPILLSKGIYVDSTDGAKAFSFIVWYRKE